MKVYTGETLVWYYFDTTEEMETARLTHGADVSMSWPYTPAGGTPEAPTPEVKAGFTVKKKAFAPMVEG